MMRSLLLTGALACTAACAQNVPVPAAHGWIVYADTAAWQASDVVPVGQIDDDWSGYSPRDGRNTVLLRSRVAAGVRKDRWRLGLEARQDAYLTTDRATLDAYHMYQQKRKPAPPAGFALQARYLSWQAQGVRAGYLFDAPGIGGRTGTVEVSGAVYGRQRLRERSVHGTLSYPAANTYGFAASHIDANSRMTYPFMGGAPSASGAGLSLAAAVPLADAWMLRVQADDLASRLRWKNLPVNTESLGSDSAFVDVNGHVAYRPLLSGRKRQVERSFRIPRYTAAALDYRYQDWGAGVHLARYAGETIPTLSLSRRFGWLTLRGTVETRFDSAGIGVEAGNFRMLLQSDSIRPGHAKTIAFEMHYHLTF
jgi:hypothetical protein